MYETLNGTISDIDDILEEIDYISQNLSTDVIYVSGKDLSKIEERITNAKNKFLNAKTELKEWASSMKDLETRTENGTL